MSESIIADATMIELYGADVIECENCCTILTAPDQVRMEPIYDYYPIVAAIHLCEDCHRGYVAETPPSPVSSVVEMECEVSNDAKEHYD